MTASNSYTSQSPIELPTDDERRTRRTTDDELDSIFTKESMYEKILLKQPFLKVTARRTDGSAEETSQDSDEPSDLGLDEENPFQGEGRRRVSSFRGKVEEEMPFLRKSYQRGNRKEASGYLMSPPPSARASKVRYRLFETSPMTQLPRQSTQKMIDPIQESSLIMITPSRERTSKIIVPRVTLSLKDINHWDTETLQLWRINDDQYLTLKRVK